MTDGDEQEKRAFEALYVDENLDRWGFHITKDPLTRYLRDRRLALAVQYVLDELKLTLNEVKDETVLVVCGGVGGEAIFFANLGFRSVTNTDFSPNALRRCEKLDARLKTMILNAEALDLENETYDFVVVQDGLHHLSRPVLGYTEMLRVARKAVIVIEPHTGIVGRLLGTEWEHITEGVNYVFRWNQVILEQCAKSYLLERGSSIEAHRIWDHDLTVGRIARAFPRPVRMFVARTVYLLLQGLLPFLGNNMVGVVVKSAVAREDGRMGAGHPQRTSV